MAKSKQPRSRRARAKKRSANSSRTAASDAAEANPSRSRPSLAAVERASATTLTSRLALADAARKVVARSGWQKTQDALLARQCRELVTRLRETCPDVVSGRPLKPGEVAGEITLRQEEFQAMVLTAAGAGPAPTTVWNNGTNELQVELRRIAVKPTEGVLQVLIPVSCNETGAVTIEVTFATGGPGSTAGLIFAADEIPVGPPEIVEIWGEALVALAWTAVLRAISALADVAGTDLDGSGLVPAGMSATGGGVRLLVMARHEMERVAR